ncbi:AAA ATPase-like protein [Streptomyces sp. SLBN-118]|uniref:ATP-binding protein n=1 Tax=Streptomyces sp. SLBN-118 TaxID=2768454 RepID=UPI00114E861D|nr:AAA family ATPase [Streptomyces sp. SLBN-118]TQK42844.1 AAA ATPase-like protein [Streptomyces sp. SLBN-118]
MTRRAGRTRRRLFEREAELAAVDEALSELTGLGADDLDPPERPGGALLAFAGHAGLGKTTLLAEVRRRAAAKGCTVLSARGGDQEQQVAFHVARQLIQPQLAGSSDAALKLQLGSWYAIVGPALGLCTAGAGAPPDPQGLRDGLDWVLAHLAARRAPLVLVLDDAHWADPESLSWLAAFAPRAEQLPMLLVVAYRPEELPHYARQFRDLPGRAGQRPIDLEPLTAPAVGRLVREQLGAHADDAFCRECWAVTAGNPFEAVELTAKVSDRGLEPNEAGAHLLRDLAAAVKGSGLIERIERLGTSTVRLAWAGAVLGTEIQPALAASVAGLGTEEAADAADRLRDARILTGPATADGTLEFVHPLIATAVYRAIPDAARVALHGQAAWSVLDAGLGSTSAARHLMETHPESDPWVVHQLRRAARETLRAGAPDAARRHLARALREPPAHEDRAAVLYELGCASLLTEPATTVNHLRAALEEPIADPALRQGIVYRLSQVLAHSDRLGEASDTLAREARLTSDPRTRLRMQSEKFMWDAFRADEPDSPARSRHLARLADRLTGRDLTERYIIGLRAWDAMLRAEPAAVALGHAERALQGGLSWAVEDRGFEVPVLVALTFMYGDRPGRAEELFAAGTAEFERQGWRGAHLSFAYTLLAYIRFRRGRLAEAEDFVRAGLRLAERVGPRTPVEWYALGTLVEVLLARGRTDEAVQVAEDHDFGEPFPAAVTFPDSQTVYGELLLARGRAKEAAVELAAAGRRLDPRGMRNPAWCPWQLHLALAEAQDDPERARATALEAVRRARRFATASAVGQALRVAAEVSGGTERTALLEEAVTHLERSPAAYELARALVNLGTHLRRTGRSKDAAEHLYRGLEAAGQCGADGLADAARDELAAAGLRPRRLRAIETDALTTRERTAAVLTAQGRDRSFVAAALHVDEQTVTRLLSAVYRKAGTDEAGLADAIGSGRSEGREGGRGQ